MTPPEPSRPTVLDTPVVGDWELVAAAQNGDQWAFGELYERYVGLVFSFVLARTGRRPLSEDFTSETFTRALRKLPELRDTGHAFPALLITIARNIIYDHSKSSHYKLCRPRGEFTEVEITDHRSDTLDPAEIVTARDTTQYLNTKLRRHIQALSPDQQECLHLRFVAGLNTVDTAAAMGRNVDAAKSIQHRALGALRRRLSDETLPELLHA